MGRRPKPRSSDAQKPRATPTTTNTPPPNNPSKDTPASFTSRTPTDEADITLSSLKKKNVKNTVPSSLKKKSVKNTAPSSLKKKNVKNAAPSSLKKKYVKNATPSSLKKKNVKNTTPSTCVRQSSRLLNANAVRIARSKNIKPVVVELDAFYSEIPQPQDLEKQQSLTEPQDPEEPKDSVEQQGSVEPKAQEELQVPLERETRPVAPKAPAKPEIRTDSNISKRSLEEKVEYLFQLVSAHEKKIEALNSEATSTSFLIDNPIVADLTYKRLYTETEKKNEDLRAENSRLAVMHEKAIGLLNYALGRVDTCEKMNSTFSDALEKLKDTIPPTQTRAPCNALNQSFQARGSVFDGLTAPEPVGDGKNRAAKKLKVVMDS